MPAGCSSRVQAFQHKKIAQRTLRLAGEQVSHPWYCAASCAMCKWHAAQPRSQRLRQAVHWPLHGCLRFTALLSCSLRLLRFRLKCVVP